MEVVLESKCRDDAEIAINSPNGDACNITDEDDVNDKSFGTKIPEDVPRHLNVFVLMWRINENDE